MGIESLLRLGLRTPVPAGITYLRGGPGIAGLASALTPAHRAGLLRPSALAFRAAPPESKARRAVIGSAGEVVTITGPEVVCLPNAPDSAQRAQARASGRSRFARRTHGCVTFSASRSSGRGPTRSCSLRHRMAPTPSRGASAGDEPPLFLHVADAAALGVLAKATGAKSLPAWPATAEDARAYAGQSARSLVVALGDGVAFVEDGGTGDRSRAAPRSSSQLRTARTPLASPPRSMRSRPCSQPLRTKTARLRRSTPNLRARTATRGSVSWGSLAEAVAAADWRSAERRPARGAHVLAHYATRVLAGFSCADRAAAKSNRATDRNDRLWRATGAFAAARGTRQATAQTLRDAPSAHRGPSGGLDPVIGNGGNGG